MGVIQMIFEIFTFIVLFASLFFNVDRNYHKKSSITQFKLISIISSIVGLIVFWRYLAQYSILFLIIGIISIGKRKESNGEQQNSKVSL